MSHSGLAPSTVRTYRHEVRYFVRWLEERTATPITLKTLTSADLLSYRQQLINVQQLRSATVNKRLQALRWLCRWTRRQGLVRGDPAAEIKSMRVARRCQPAGLTELEVHSLLRVAGMSRKGQRDRNYGRRRGNQVGRATGGTVADVFISYSSNDKDFVLLLMKP